MHQYILRSGILGSRFALEDLWPLVGTQANNQQLTCTERKGGILGCMVWECWQVEDEHFLLLSTGEVTSRPLVVGSQVQDRYRRLTEAPANSHEDD